MYSVWGVLGGEKTSLKQFVKKIFIFRTRILFNIHAFQKIINPILFEDGNHELRILYLASHTSQCIVSEEYWEAKKQVSSNSLKRYSFFEPEYCSIFMHFKRLLIQYYLKMAIMNFEYCIEHLIHLNV